MSKKLSPDIQNFAYLEMGGVKLLIKDILPEGSYDPEDFRIVDVGVFEYVKTGQCFDLKKGIGYEKGSPVFGQWPHKPGNEHVMLHRSHIGDLSLEEDKPPLDLTPKVSVFRAKLKKLFAIFHFNIEKQ